MKLYVTVQRENNFHHSSGAGIYYTIPTFES